MRQPRPTRIEQFRQAVEGPGAGGDRPRSAQRRSNATPPRRGRRRGQGKAGTATLVVWCAVAVIGAYGAIGFGLPTIRATWDPPVLVGSLGAVAVAVVGVRRSPTVPLRRRRWVLGVSVALVALFALGASTQLVLDGRPQLAVSDEARAHALVETLYDDILVLRDADELIAYEQADARARYNDYEPAIAELRSISNRWSRADLGSLPDPDLIDVVSGVKVAATFGAEALAIRFRIITEPDERSEQAMAENRAALFDSTLTAAAGLKPLAERYQVDVGAGGRGE